jgi:hypothetical protein
MSERHVTLDTIIEAVCATTGHTRLDVVSDRRSEDLAEARYAVFWLSAKLTTLSSSTVARLVGDRDHSTVLAGQRRAEELRATCPAFLSATDTLLHMFVALERVGVLRLAEAADPLATARRVLAAPEREAVRVGVSEIIALCRFALNAESTATSSKAMENSDAA